MSRPDADLDGFARLHDADAALSQHASVKEGITRLIREFDEPEAFVGVEPFHDPTDRWTGRCLDGCSVKAGSGSESTRLRIVGISVEFATPRTTKILICQTSGAPEQPRKPRSGGGHALTAYVYCSALPLAAGFLLDGRTLYVAMGCMAVVFVAAVTFAAIHFNRAFVSGVRLNLDLSERTEELTKRTEELIAANTRLQAEMAQREAAENQLHQAQKMKALGQLTGGIAHDFNNLLTAVIGNLELAQKRTGGDPDFARPLDAALSAAERGATLIQDLLTFARRKPLHPRAVDVSAVVDDVEKILKQTIGPAICLMIRTAPDVNPAWVDPNQLGLAILNLALNARDAMPCGGRLQIVCENQRADAGEGPGDLAAGDYVIVSVSDTGIGMSEATMAHAFEPFFTTKEAGRGSGMGLSMVQGFAAQSGGTVQIASSLGKGTTVKLWLPPAECRATVSVSPEPTEFVIRQRRARILVCDDDGDVARWLARCCAISAIRYGKRLIPSLPYRSSKERVPSTFCLWITPCPK
jgi:signal transduction histidine kinase